MTTDPRPWDVTELDAGNARRLDALERADAILDPLKKRAAEYQADLDAAADALGVALPDLVQLRRQLGIAAKHRRPSLIDRLFRRS